MGSRMSAFSRRGLPPLARGAPEAGVAHVLDDRPTPARAGSTSSPTPTRRRGRAYPRSRGEHVSGAPSISGLSGLPPLARGAPRLVITYRTNLRPTPARAGSTSRSVPSGSVLTAYPRSRGEHAKPAQPVYTIDGLPPLARGARTHEPSLAARPGPTPARAGSTSPCRGRRRTASAYPRSRGEHTHWTFAR